MTPIDDLPEVVRGYFAERAESRTSPALLEAVLGRTGAIRPSPGWLVRLIRPGAFRGVDGAGRSFGAKLAGSRERPGTGIVSPRARVPSLGWAVVVLALVGLLVAAALIAGNANLRPILSVVPTGEITPSPTGEVTASPAAVVTAPSVPASTPHPECNGIGRSRGWVIAESPGGTLAPAGSTPKGAPSNGLVAYATRDAIRSYDPAKRTTTRLASLARDISVGNLSWSPDGRHLAFTIGIGTATASSSVDVFWCDLWVMNADGSGLTVLAPLMIDTRDSVENVLWSPDGRTIAYNGNGFEDSVFVVTIGGSSRQLPGTNGCWSEAWSPDGTRIACGGSIVNVATGEFTHQDLLPNGGSPSSDPPAWAADSQSFTALGQSTQDRVTAYRIAVDGTILSSIDLAGSSAFTPGSELSPDGSRVLARVCPVPCVNDVPYEIVPIDGSAVLPIGRGTSAVWSQDGSKVAMTVLQGIAVAKARDGTTRSLVEATGLSGVIWWSPDQGYLLYTLASGQLWMVPALGGDATRIDAGPMSTYRSVAWQPTLP